MALKERCRLLAAEEVIGLLSLLVPSYGSRVRLTSEGENPLIHNTSVSSETGLTSLGLKPRPLRFSQSRYNILI